MSACGRGGTGERRCVHGPRLRYGRLGHPPGHGALRFFVRDPVLIERSDAPLDEARWAVGQMLRSRPGQACREAVRSRGLDERASALPPRPLCELCAPIPRDRAQFDVRGRLTLKHCARSPLNEACELLKVPSELFVACYVRARRVELTARVEVLDRKLGPPFKPELMPESPRAVA